MSTDSLNQTAQSELDQLIEPLPSLIPAAVRRACLRFHYQVSADKVADLSQQIIVQLMEQDSRRLRSFAQKSSFATWLEAVTSHHVSNYFRNLTPTESLEEVFPDQAAYPPTQESSVLRSEKRELVNKAVERLTVSERWVFELCYVKEMEASEVARLLRIKVHSVYRYKHLVLTKLRQGVLAQQAA